MAETTRREFLTASALGAGVVAVEGLRNGEPVKAAEPVKRRGESYTKLSLAAYSFNRMLPRGKSRAEFDSAEMTLADFVDFCATQRIAGTELTGYYFPADPAEADRYALELKQQCFRLGLDVSGTAIGNDFCHPAGEQRDAQIAACKEWIDRAAILGAPVIRIFAGRQKSGQSEAEAVELCVAGIDECLQHAATRGVFLALENHGGITATPEQMLRIVHAVQDSPWFGVNFDSGNFRTDEPYRDLAKIAPYAVNAQIKVAIAPNGKKQPADLKRIVGILKEAGYRGYVVLEYEEREDPGENIPRYLEELRALTRV